MEPKKSPSADVERWSGVYRDLGLVIALALVLSAFTYRKTTVIENTLTSNIVFDEEEDLADITKEEQKPPPPPPPPEIQVVEDEEIIEEKQPEFEEVDIDVDFEQDLEEPVIEDEADEPVFAVVEEMPEFPGGQAALIQFLSKYVVYPEMEKQNDIEGVSYVQFVVDKDGNITNVKILPGTESKGTQNMHNEAMRVITSMPKWKPGKQRGKAVKVSYQIPVRFKLR
ncbi:MAG: energy transducer TonB [Bacteroidetes bacterium]|nr:energy transducer TonB [Bacteroidota bacterium]